MKLIVILASMINFTYAASIADGGISGGGGNVINPTAPTKIQDPREVSYVIKGSKQLLKKFINGKFTLYKTGSMSYEDLKMYSMLFADNESNLHEVMEEIKLDIHLDRPCFDQNGKEFDGSTYDLRTNRVCISAFNIAKKVDLLEVPIQAAALVLHEYSEVVGLTDDEAITLQKQALEELKYFGN